LLVIIQTADLTSAGSSHTIRNFDLSNFPISQFRAEGEGNKIPKKKAFALGERFLNH